MAAASCNDVHLSAGIEQHGFVTTPEVVKQQLLEPHLSYPTGKLLADVARASWLGKRQRVGEHQTLRAALSGPDRTPQRQAHGNRW
jgi:hypothetical protein